MGVLNRWLHGWRQQGRKRRRASLLLAALLIPACTYLRAAPEPALANPQLTELSGLTRSLATDDWLWGHNDSGCSDGGVVPVPDAVAIDWEDIATLRWRGQPALLIGDIGDNAAKRAAITLYAVRDPGATGTSAPLLWQLNLRYPDGPRDAEGLAVDPLNGDILILSKRERPPVIYRVPMPGKPPAPGAIFTAEKLGPVLHLPVPTAVDLADDPLYGLLRDWPTALDIAPDGLSAIVTTYKDAHRYRRSADESWATAFARVPQLEANRSRGLLRRRAALLCGQRAARGFCLHGAAATYALAAWLPFIRCEHQYVIDLSDSDLHVSTGAPL